MKKLFAVLTIIFLVYACTPKVAPVTTPVYDTVVVSTHDIPPPPPPRDETTANMIRQGQTIYTTKCVKCHGLKNTKEFTKLEWDGIIKEMAPKAKLNAEETASVTAYVKANAKPT